MTQAAVIGELWSHIRDTQFGETEKSANDLRHICQLEFEPPSRAHVKRVKRVRVEVIRRSAKPDVPCPVRQHYNHVGRDANAIVAMLRPNFIALKLGRQLEPNPVRVGPTHVEPKPAEPVLTSFEDIRAHDTAKRRDVQRGLKRDYMIERARTCASLRKPHPFTVDEIVDLFGSVQHFEEQCHD